jgi:hypothetical protein
VGTESRSKLFTTAFELAGRPNRQDRRSFAVYAVP